MAVQISPERPDTDDARALIAELEAELVPLYPQASRHGYSVDKLIARGVAFFVVRQDGAAAGCGGVLLYGSEYGELKRMFMRPGYRVLGLAKQLLEHLAGYARSCGVMLLRLETGIHQHAAIGLYEQMDFRLVSPFGSYREDPLSRFYEKTLSKA